MSATVCPGCGSASLQQDAHFCQDQRVCTDCGMVLEEGSLHNDPADSFAPSRPSLSLPLKYRQRNKYHGHVPRGVRAGVQKVEEISAMLRITSPAMVEEGKELFRRAYDLCELKWKRKERKRVLPGCCVYIVCRQHDWPITAPVMWDLLQCRDSFFYSIYRTVLTELDIVITVPDIEAVVPSVIKKCDFTFKLDEAQIQTVTQIICLAKNTWIACGRRYDPVIIAAVYLIWKTADYGKRKNVRIPAFCRLMRSGPKVVGLVRCRVNELEGVLVKLGSEIPWVQPGEINRKNVVCYIADILKYEKTLLNGKDVFADDSDEESGDEDAKVEGKFLPPSMQTSKAAPDIRDTDRAPCDIITPVSNSTELGERDIPDSEMHKYIRTTEEVKMVQEALERNADKPETDSPQKRKKPSSKNKPCKKKRFVFEDVP